MPLSTIDNTGLSQSQILSAINMPTGGVIQVVQGLYNTLISTSSSTFVTTNLTASITPQFSTSKILAMYSIPGQTGTPTAAAQITTTLYRGSTNLALSGGNQGFGQIYTSTSINVQGITSGIYLDSPNTTTSTTYTVYYASTNVAATVSMYNNNCTGTLTLMEIR